MAKMNKIDKGNKGTWERESATSKAMRGSWAVRDAMNHLPVGFAHTFPLKWADRPGLSIGKNRYKTKIFPFVPSRMVSSFVRPFADIELQFPPLFAVTAEAPQFQRADFGHLGMQV